MINKIIIQGYIGNNADITKTEGGTMCRFNIAYSESWKDKDTGEWRDKTIWIPIVCFQEALIEKVLAERAVKGAYVLIDGEIKSFDYTDSNNIRHSGIEVMIGRQGSIEFLPTKPKTQNDTQEGAA